MQGVIQRNSPLRNVSTTKTEVKTEVHKENDEPLRPLHKKKYCLNDRMIDERHKKSTESLKIRNHALMWDESAENPFEVLNAKVTGTQAMHKNNSPKKNWNKIIDAPSGSAAAKKKIPSTKIITRRQAQCQLLCWTLMMFLQPRSPTFKLYFLWSKRTRTSFVTSVGQNMFMVVKSIMLLSLCITAMSVSSL